MHSIHDFTIIVHIHEQVLAPLGSRFCIVAKHHAFEPHAQCCLRSQQRHSCFFRRAVAFPVVALDASRHYVHRRVLSTTRTRQDVIERQLSHTLLLAAILATELVTHVNTQALHVRLLATAANVYVSAPTDYRRHWEFIMRRTQHAIAVEIFDEDRVLERHDDCAGDTDGAERLVSLIEQKNSAIECHCPAPPFVWFISRGLTRIHADKRKNSEQFTFLVSDPRFIRVHLWLLLIWSAR